MSEALNKAIKDAFYDIERTIKQQTPLGVAWDNLEAIQRQHIINHWTLTLHQHIRQFVDAEEHPAPLFTRTVYSVAELHAQIDAIEALGFTNYVTGRDVERVTPALLTPPYDRDRWIIKVYGEVAE